MPQIDLNTSVMNTGTKKLLATELTFQYQGCSVSFHLGKSGMAQLTQVKKKP